MKTSTPTRTGRKAAEVVSMKISARNRLKGKITQVTKGATTSHIGIDVGGTIMMASITNEAVDELKLKVGQEAFAIVKLLSVDGAILTVQGLDCL